MRQRTRGAMAIGLMVLLFGPCWRPSKDPSRAPVFRSTAKGPRRSPPELPETSLSRLKKRETRAAFGERSPGFPIRQSIQSGSCAFLSPIVGAIVLQWRGQPRYLQSYALGDSHSTPAPPAA